MVAIAVLVVVRNTGSAARECDGSAELCERRLDEVALATTHNSMNAAADGFLYPSQHSGIATQLEDGVRGFLVDAYVGSVRRPTRATSSTPIWTAAGSRPRSRPRPLRRRIARSSCASRQALRQTTRPARSPLSRLLRAGRRRVRRRRRHAAWVPRGARRRGPGRDHPGRAVRRPAASRARGRRPGSLPRHARPGPAAPDAGLDGGDRPASRARAGERRPRPQIPNAYASGLLQETQYKYSSVEELERPTSCRPKRGDRDAPLLLLNHWISPPSEQAASQANAEDVLLPRAERCSEEREQPVNLVAVDFYETGDLFGVVGRLNGTSAR